jgi:exportin-1
MIGFKNQSTVLAKLFRLIEGGDIQAPLFDPAAHDPTMTNQRFVAEYCANLLRTAFPHLQPCVLILFFLSSKPIILTP